MAEDNKNIQMAHRYVEQWKQVREKNLGLLLWGDVGTGKSFVAACIANALLEKGVPVLMTNFSKILNQMGAMYSEGRYRYIASFSDFSLLIIDDLGIERNTEYAPLVERLEGQVIKISPSSSQYINPMDINLNYSVEDNPLALKADFILSLCELIVGGKESLQPVEKTVIDRCVHQIYQPFFENPKPENTPLLQDLYNALLVQEEKEARHVATALEIYVSGSLNLFNRRTNVDIQNRLVCYDIKELGKQLKKLGMLVVQDQVWGRVTANRNAGKSTRYYVDEFHRAATRCRI